MLEILGEGKLTSKQAESLIMKAREHWFANDDDAENAEGTETGSSSENTETKEQGAEQEEAPEQNIASHA